MNKIFRSVKKLEWQFKIEDMWIGAFWKEKEGIIYIWLCFLPCVPLHIQLWKNAWIEQDVRDIEDIPF